MTAAMLIIFFATAYTEPLLIEEVGEDGKQYITKVFEVSADTNPNSLIEADFKKGQYLYTKSDIKKEDVEEKDVREERQSVTVNTTSNKTDDIVAKLEPQIEYDEDGYQGALYLNTESITTKASGYGTNSSPITETKTYNNLERNDPSYIEKSIQKDGKTLNLTNVSWSMVGSEESPSYKAVATYSGTSTSQYVKGYVSTAEYIGEVSKPNISKALVTITYTGEKQFPVKEVVEYSLIFILIAAITALVYFLLILKKNVKIYNLQNEQYILIGKDRISIKYPVLDLNKEFKSTSDKYAVVLNKGLTRKMFGKQVTVAYKEEKLYYMIEGYNTEFWFKVGDEHEE